ncbi:MAG: CpXC domain-containing protein [Nitrospiraceae bacterium]|nr:CpXC domain-containing protein [Nitrospiraceae bacterium]
MFNLTARHAEAYSQETFRCGNCNRDFSAKVITWVDVSRTPQVKQSLLTWRFNVIQCTSCGCRQFAETPFFYEDFHEGLLVAVFPKIPDSRGQVEAAIKEKYGYYPVLEYFYDMTQIWTLLRFQSHYGSNKHLKQLSRMGTGEERLRKFLKFLKEDSLMIDIRERLTESLVGDATDDDMTELLNKAMYKMEEMLPWPLDRRCICGGDLLKDFTCCGKRVRLVYQEQLLSHHYAMYCPSCKEPLSEASCPDCGRVYTWKLGTVQSYDRKNRQGVIKPEASLDFKVDPRMNISDH